MAEKVHFEIKDFPACRVIGKQIHVDCSKENPIPQFWDKCFGDGSCSRFEEMKEYYTQEHGLIGYMDNADETTFDYIVGMFLKPEAPVPEGYIYRDVPAMKIAVSWIEGVDLADIVMSAHGLTVSALKDGDYDLFTGPCSYCAEVYDYSRFVAPQAEGKKFIMDYWITVEKKQNK